MRSPIRKLILCVCLVGTNLFAIEFDDAKDELDLRSPFYMPYAGDWVARMQAQYTSQNFSMNLAFPQGSKSAQTDDYSSIITLVYGITDRISMAASTKYTLAQEYNETNTGAFAAKGDEHSTKSGFADPTISVTGRLWGTLRDEWTLNVAAAFTPGITDANNFRISTPNNRFATSVLFGRNFNNITLGIQESFSYYQDSAVDSTNQKNGQQTLASALVAQYDFFSFYIQATGAIINFVDARSQSDGLRKQPLGNFGATFGVECSESLLFSANFSWTTGLQGQSSLPSGINYSASAKPTMVGTLAILYKYGE
ncbi:MAG: hypothetical protein JSR44_08505 [Spirochaetes bacterium]|nr:hypothetical protein [Spirochaetota bacterium]